MLDMPKISVIMPCFNGVKKIENAIESFLLQTYEHKELIIVDGKSTDGSHDVIFRYTEKHDNIKWVKEHDTCVTDALNIGIKSSDAEFVGFLMTDDHYIYSDFFGECIQLSKYIDFDVLYSNTYYFLTHESHRLIYYWKPEQKLSRLEMLKSGTSVAIIDSTIIRRSVFNKHSLDPEYNLCSDYEFFLRIADDSILFMYLDKFTTCCLYEGDNLSAKNQQIQTQLFSKVIIKFLIDNLSDEENLIFHKMLAGEQLTKRELLTGEEILIKIVEANNEKQFYPVGFFYWHVIGIWIKANKNIRRNKLLTKYKIYSSPLYNNGIKANKLIIFAKNILSKVI